MEERAACALLKQRFEAAGFQIEENRMFDENGVRFEIDGFDAVHRVGYEYVTAEAGDGWDVDGNVIAALAERRERGELHVLIVEEAQAPDAISLGTVVDGFLAELRDHGVIAAEPAARVEPEALHVEPEAPHVEPEAPHVEPEAPHVEVQPPAAEPPAATEPAQRPANKPKPSRAKSSPAKAKTAKKKPSRK